MAKKLPGDDPFDPQLPDPSDYPGPQKRCPDGSQVPPSQPCPPPTGPAAPGGEISGGGMAAFGQGACPPGQCRDVVTGACRGFNPNREKVNETDRPGIVGQGGRGFCRKRDFGGRGGPGGGGAGVGGPPGPGVGAGPGFQGLLDIGKDIDDVIKSQVLGLLNQGSRFTPAVMQDLAAGAKLESEAQRQRLTEGATQESLRRGIFRSPLSLGLTGEAERAAEQNFSTSMRQVRLQKVNADFEDKVIGLGLAQKNLDSLRNYAAQLDQTQAQREATQAQLQLGYARIKAEMDQLLLRLQSDRDLMAMQLENTNFLAILHMIYGS